MKLDDPKGNWMRDDVHYPEPVSAFGDSVYLRAIERGIVTMARDFGLMFDGFVSHWRGGEVYGRVVPPGGKEGPPPPWWVLGLLSRILPSMRERVRAADRMMAPGKLKALADAWDREGRDRFEKRIRQLAAINLRELDDEGLDRHLDEVVALLEEGQQTHFALFLPYVVPMHRFVVVADELLGWDAKRVLALLAGHSEASAAPGRELEEIAAQIRDHAGAASAVATAADPAEALRDIDESLSNALADWTERWGLRAIAYDCGAPTLSEKPDLLAGLIRDAVADQLNKTDTSSDALAETKGLSRADKQRFDDALAEARAAFPLREDNVLYTDNLVCGLARRTAVEFGRRLVDRDLLDAPELAVELRIDEMRDALAAGTDVRALANDRAEIRRWVANNPGPSYFGEPPPPPPDMRGLPAAARTINEAFTWLMMHEYPPPSSSVDEPKGTRDLQGIGAWPGTYTGAVRVVRSNDDLAAVRPGDVMVASITVPAWSVVFPRIGALVTDRGGLLSHAAIVAREHGIPTVLATRDATTRLHCGQRVTVDGGNGTVTVC